MKELSENAFQQCKNCANKNWILFGKVSCKSIGVKNIDYLKTIHHCALQFNKQKPDNMKTNKKIIRLVVIFLLLIPFRLPISAGLIHVFNQIANLGTFNIPDHILQSNVLVTKLIYNLVLSGLFVWNMELLSRQIKGRPSYDYPKNQSRNEEHLYWWNFLLTWLLAGYTAFDCTMTWYLFDYVK